MRYFIFVVLFSCCNFCWAREDVEGVAVKEVAPEDSEGAEAGGSTDTGVPMRLPRPRPSRRPGAFFAAAITSLS